MSLARTAEEQEVVTVAPEATALEAARLMAERRVGALVVTTPDARPIGIVTDRDLVTRVLAARLDPGATPVRSVMSAPLVTARAGSTDHAVRMGLEGVRRLPLVDDAGRLVGIVSLDDLLAIHAHRLGCLAQVVARAH
jgi:CBS domain-containing protein